MKKIATLLCLSTIVVCIAGCSLSKPSITEPVIEDTKYHAATVNISEDDFEEAGFELGDSCDVTFGNGYSLKDVPYYNGYYVKTGDPIIIAYPGARYISITYNNEGIWDEAGLSYDDETVTITLNEAGKYADIQESLGQSYSFDRNDYDSDEQYCNFRALTGGNLKENFLYRGASPVDNSRGRASDVDPLLEANGIKFILDLADSEEEMEDYLSDNEFDSPYAKSLYESGNVALLDMASDYKSSTYHSKLATGLKQMINAQGPMYIHCMEGKDRTGFVCMLLEALAGASYDEMKADYMTTYDNYYGINEEDEPDKYDAVAELYFDSFMSYLHGTEDISVLTEADYTQDARDFLLEGGMTDEEVDALQTLICK